MPLRKFVSVRNRQIIEMPTQFWPNDQHRVQGSSVIPDGYYDLLTPQLVERIHYLAEKGGSGGMTATQLSEAATWVQEVLDGKHNDYGRSYFDESSDRTGAEVQ